jgi:NitT/TauT family transport system substrate-binding protein
MRIAHLIAAVFVAAFAAGNAHAQSPEKISFGTNWVAQGEHGGFYQALADGTYRRFGLDVNIVQGGPNANNRLLLPAGRLDF